MKVNMGCNFMRSAREKTSPCEQSRGPRPPREMPSPTKSKRSKFEGHVPARLSAGVNCSCDQSPQSNENQPYGVVCLQNIASKWCSWERYLALTYDSKILSKNKRAISYWFDFQLWSCLKEKWDESVLILKRWEVTVFLKNRWVLSNMGE